MVGFSSILATGYVEDQKMIKDKWLEILVVNLMVIQFYRKFGKFYCIGVIN